LCFATEEDFSFETRIFRRIIEAAEVTEEQAEMLMKCFDIILGMYQFLDLSDRTEKRVAKKLITRTHPVALTKGVMAAVARMFFGDSRSTSVDAAYNAACGAGSARRDKIVSRMDAIENHFARYVRIEQANSPATQHESNDENADDETYADDEAKSHNYGIFPMRKQVIFPQDNLLRRKCGAHCAKIYGKFVMRILSLQADMISP